METRWLYTTSENFAALREASKKTCIIPMGCIEKHGLHLPLGTDILKGSHIAYMASQLETVTVFPDFTFGDVPCGAHAERPDGTICIDVRFQMDMLETFCEEIGANGFEKILVVNSHGGNTSWLAAFTRNLACKPRNYLFATYKVPLVAPHIMAEQILAKGPECMPELTKEDIDLLLKYHEEKMSGGHACMGETAHIMGFAPESVHLDRLGIESGLKHKCPPLEKFIEAGINLASNGWHYTSPNWFSGHDPVGCNERIGKASLRVAAELTAKAIKVFKDDDFFYPDQMARRINK